MAANGGEFGQIVSKGGLALSFRERLAGQNGVIGAT
jgi:hypothetical protein